MLTQTPRRDGRPRNDTSGPAFLQKLFPETPAPADAPADGPAVPVAVRRARTVAIHAVVLLAAMVVMLERIPGRPAWDTIYNEDLTVYLVDGLSRPWHLYIVYGGYEQLLPRLVGQLVVLLPLRYAAKVFALSAALISAACAVLVFHATAGHIRSVALRVLAGASVLFLPIATLEIADSTVNTPWYLLLALFWATLWRPRTRTGMAAVAITAFLASASVPLTVIFAPLLAIRLIALRRWREHAVTIGWAAGLLAQVPAILQADATHQSRLNAPVPIVNALSFYARGVVQSMFGWHIGWWLQSAVGSDGAEAIVGAILVAFFAWALVAGPLQARLLIATTLLFGFLFAVISSDLGYAFAGIGWRINEHHEAGSRYATLAMFLMDCAAIVAIDALVQRVRAGRPVRGSRQGGGRHELDGLTPNGRTRTQRVVPVLAVLALVVALAAGWATDYRFLTPRAGGSGRTYDAVLQGWVHACDKNPTGSLQMGAWDLPSKATESVPCSRIRP
jgi:hypothetical protein